jgi:hypothetical protein
MVNGRAAHILKIMSAIEQAADRCVHYESYSAHLYGCITKIALYIIYSPNIVVMFLSKQSSDLCHFFITNLHTVHELNAL